MLFAKGCNLSTPACVVEYTALNSIPENFMRKDELYGRRNNSQFRERSVEVNSSDRDDGKKAD